MKNKHCENCNKKSQMNVTMPLPLGIFTGDLCIKDGMMINDDPQMLMKIIKKRAEDRKIKLPVIPEIFKTLLLK